MSNKLYIGHGETFSGGVRYVGDVGLLTDIVRPDTLYYKHSTPVSPIQLLESGAVPDTQRPWPEHEADAEPRP